MALVAPCRTGTARVDIVLGRTSDMAGDDENKQVGVWTAGSASDQASELSLTDPGDDWEGMPVRPPAPGESWILDGTFTGEEETVLIGPFVSAGQMEGLTPDQVLVADGEQSRAIDREAFDGDC